MGVINTADMGMASEYAVRASAYTLATADAPAQAMDPMKVAQGLAETRKRMQDNRKERNRLDAEYESLTMQFQQLAGDFVGWLERG